MSTDYNIVCHKHKEQVNICTDGMSGPMLFCDKSLSAFCITHSKCNLNIISEHNECEYNEWNSKNWKAKLNYDLES